MIFWISIILIIFYISLYTYSQIIITKYKITDYSFEKIFQEEQEETKTIKSPESLYLSLVVPAYNEQERVTFMLDETIEYFLLREKKDEKFTWEIIIVDDGSKDSTSDVIIKVFLFYL
jgi:dolichyl-phosphate beta-glucosyltransferase